MKDVNWNNEKNDWLRKERGISFEIVRYYIENGEYVDIIEHPQKERYPNQRIFVLDIEDYIYCVPFVESETEIFLKTIFPSRPFTKKYLNREISPMKYYDKKEKELIESVERGEWKSIENLEEEKKRYSKIFKASSKKSERVTINLTQKDLKDLKIKASIEGLPYQTLIGSVLHKYVTGKLVEKSA